MEETGNVRTKRYRAVKTPTVFQLEAAECGAACLSMILQYHGKYVPQDKLREMAGVSRDGSKAGNIMRTAEELGMEVHGFRRETDQLLAMKPPCIIHWEFNHFVVFEGVKGKKILLNDPAMGRRRLSYEEFNNGFTGIAITFAPTDKFVREKKQDSFLDLVLETARQNKAAFIALFLIGILLVIPGFVISMLSGTFVDYVLRNQKIGLVFGIILVMAIMLAFQIAFQFYNNVLLLRLQNKLSLISASRMMSSMFRLPMRFFELRFAGDLSTRLNHNIQVAQFLSQNLTSIAISVVESVFYFILLLWISPGMSAIVLIGLIMQLFIIRKCSESLKELFMRQNRETGRVVGILTSGLTISDSLKTAGAEEQFLARLIGSYTKVANSEQKTGVRQQVLNALPRGIAAQVQVLLLLVGGLLVMYGSQSQGSLVAFITLYAQFLSPIQKISGFISQLNMIRADCNYVQDITEGKQESKYQKSLEIPEQVRMGGTLDISGLTFGYNIKNAPLIDDFALKVPKGGSVALVGASGSGKSTIVKLISGLLEPWSGEVCLDGVNLKDLPNEVIHLNMASVSQDIHFFRGSIRDNLTMWNPAIPEDNLIRAVKDACIYDTILEKEDGFEFKLGEGGGSFSGGERQRLEIARALVTDPSVLFMDEATSALDPITEAKVIENILKRGCTLVISAHRLSTIRDCGEIILLDGGKVKARGTHSELMESSPEYQDLVKQN